MVVAITLSLTSFANHSSAAGGGGGGNLFAVDFDSDTTGAWFVNDSFSGLNVADFYFDYSSVGIPPAPGSVGATRGLKLAVNTDPAFAAGPPPAITVSPIGQSFDGDYEVSFDWWANYLGPLETGATGSTNLATFGIMASGMAPPFPNLVDSILFAATGDGGSGADFRAYSPERVFTGYIPNGPSPLDQNATFYADSRNSSAPLYAAAFPPVAAPDTQALLFPSQSGFTTAGATGFRWNHVTILKEGTDVTFSINAIPLIVVHLDGQTLPPGGGALLLGAADVNPSTSLDPDYAVLNFSLIDNVVVRAVPEPGGLGLVLAAIAARRRWRRTSR
jgi:hypothetical protein